MTIDGKEIAESVYADLAARRKSIARPIKLGIVVGANDAVIESFVRIKSRAAVRLDVEIVRVDLPMRADTQAAINAVEKLAGEADGIIVQLPLPKELNTDAVLAAIPAYGDVDGINPSVREEDRIVRAPVASAVAEILKHSSIDPRGRRAVVVGAGRLVGAPVAALLRGQGADVSVVTLEEGGLDALKSADIAVLGAGNPGFIKPDMLKDGVVLIDAGTSEAGGKVMGDADPQCAEKALVFTPVPGGVGPIAVAMIFKNLLALIECKRPGLKRQGYALRGGNAR